MRLRILLLAALLCAPSQAERLKSGTWLFGFGMGMISAPGLFMASPHLERTLGDGWMLGMLAQAGFSANNSLFTVSATGRFMVGEHPRLRPTLEAGLGFATGSAGYAANLGFHIHGGLGIEYLWDADTAIGSIVRTNFAPPLQDFFVSWSILHIRFLF